MNLLWINYELIYYLNLQTDECTKLINSKITEASYDKDTVCYVCEILNY